MKVLDDQDTPGDEHDKDHGGLSSDLCAVHFDMAYADDGDGWTEVARGCRTGRGRHQVKHRSVLDACPAELKSFLASEFPSFSIN